MSLKVVDALCRSFQAVNEDAWGQAEGVVWALDGATGVAPQPYLGGPSDAAWFAQVISDHLAAAFATGQPTSSAIAQAVGEAARAATGLCDIAGIATFELPSACLVAARETASGLELTNLGDSVIVWRASGGVATPFGTTPLAALEETLHRVLDAALAAGRSRAEGVAEARALARENRKLMNSPEGYWILDLSGDGVPHAEIDICASQGPVDVLVMTDGFSRLVELYGVYDWDGLLDRALEVGLAPLHDELRAIEAADEDCIRHQRFKARDDATAILLSWA